MVLLDVMPSACQCFTFKSSVFKYFVPLTCFANHNPNPNMQCFTFKPSVFEYYMLCSLNNITGTISEIVPLDVSVGLFHDEVLILTLTLNLTLFLALTITLTLYKQALSVKSYRWMYQLVCFMMKSMAWSM
jgi:hypothetical protein